MDNKEAFHAAKILVDFVRDFTSLAEQQLMSIRELMEQTVQEVMNAVHDINSKASQKKNQAIEVLVKDRESSEFRSSTSKIREEVDEIAKGNVAEVQRREFLENQLRRAGGVFSKHMEALHTIDRDLQDVLFKVMGAVSMDDVMGQRLIHVIDSVLLLKEGISNVVGDYTKYGKPKEVQNLRNQILSKVYRSYTTEEEKEIFHKLFGQPREVKEAS